MGEKISTLACPTGAYAHYCLQERAFPTVTAGAGRVMLHDFPFEPAE